MSRFRLSRRAVLQGVGASVALPTLEAMLNSHGTAFAAGEPLPTRLMTFFWGNGVILNRWKPANTGAGWTPSEELAPLADQTDMVSVISGCKVKTPNSRGHHNGAAAILSGYPFVVLPESGAAYASKFGGPSIDQIAANVIGKGTLFKSLQVAVSKRVTRGEGPTLQFLSHQGPDAPLAPTFDPAALYKRLFASLTPPDTSDPSNGLRASVLDAVQADVKRLNAKLGAADRARLDRHLTGISEVRAQLIALPPPVSSSCVKPSTVVTDTNADVDGKERLKSVATLMSDLIVLAWACDLTRVVSYQFSGSVGGTVFSELGQTSSHHAYSHNANRQSEIHHATVFVMEQFAYLLKRLRATPDGASGNLLTNSVTLASTDVAEGLSHSVSDYPILVAGRGRGFLRAGMHVRSNGDNTSNVLLSVLQAAGTGVTAVGKDSGYSNIPFTAIHT